MRQDTTIRYGLLVTAVFALAATRLPAEDGLNTLLAVVTTVALVVAAGLTLWRRAPGRTKNALFIAGLLAVLVPPSSSAWLAGTPHWLVALLFLLALHVFFRDPGSRAPRLDSAGGKIRGGFGVQALRFLPAFLFAVALVGIPLLSGFLLPPRVHATFELHTAFAPLFVVLTMGSLVAALGVLRVRSSGILGSLKRRTMQAETGRREPSGPGRKATTKEVSTT